MSDPPQGRDAEIAAAWKAWVDAAKLSNAARRAAYDAAANAISISNDDKARADAIVRAGELGRTAMQLEQSTLIEARQYAALMLDREEELAAENRNPRVIAQWAPPSEINDVQGDFGDRARQDLGALDREFQAFLRGQSAEIPPDVIEYQFQKPPTLAEFRAAGQAWQQRAVLDALAREPSPSAASPMDASDTDYSDDDDDEDADVRLPAELDTQSQAGPTNSRPSEATPMDSAPSPAIEIPAPAEFPRLNTEEYRGPAVMDGIDRAPPLRGGYVPPAREVTSTTLPPTIKLKAVKRNSLASLTSGEQLRRVLNDLKKSFEIVASNETAQTSAVNWPLPLDDDPDQSVLNVLASMWFATLAFQYKSQLRADDARDGIYNGRYLRDQWNMFRLQTNAYAKIIDREMTAWFNSIVQSTISDAATEGKPSRDANSNNAYRVHTALLNFSTLLETNSDMAKLQRERDELAGRVDYLVKENQRLNTTVDRMDLDAPADSSRPSMSSSTAPPVSQSAKATLLADYSGVIDNTVTAALRASRFTRLPVPVPASSGTGDDNSLLPGAPISPPGVPKPSPDYAALLDASTETTMRAHRFATIPGAATSAPPPPQITIPATPVVPAADSFVTNYSSMLNNDATSSMRSLRFKALPIPVVPQPSAPATPTTTNSVTVTSTDYTVALDSATTARIRAHRFTALPEAAAPAITAAVPPPPRAYPDYSLVINNDTTAQMRASRFTALPPAPGPVVPTAPRRLPSLEEVLGNYTRVLDNDVTARVRAERFTDLKLPPAAAPPAPAPAKQAPAPTPRTIIENYEKMLDNDATALMRANRFTAIAQAPAPAPVPPTSPAAAPPRPSLADTVETYSKFLDNDSTARMRAARFTAFPVAQPPPVPEPARARPKVSPEPRRDDPVVPLSSQQDYSAILDNATTASMRAARFIKIPDPVVPPSPPADYSELLDNATTQSLRATRFREIKPTVAQMFPPAQFPQRNPAALMDPNPPLMQPYLRDEGPVERRLFAAEGDVLGLIRVLVEAGIQ